MSSLGYSPQRHTCCQVVWVNVELGTYWSADPDHGRIMRDKSHGISRSLRCEFYLIEAWS